MSEHPLSFSEINPSPSIRADEIKKDPNPIVILLDRMSDPRNLGAIFRLADAARLAGVFGYKTHLNEKINKVERVSRQTTEYIPFKEITEMQEVVELTKDYYPIALEYTNKSVPFTQYQGEEPSMLVIGNEQRGVSPELLELCETSLHIPMLGQNSSMNVSVASGIVTYHLLSNMGRI